MLFKSEYLGWKQQVVQDLVISFVLCVGERVIERVLLPGLHRMPGRALTDDPTRVDSWTLLFAAALGQFVLVWFFILTLYAISLLSRRPLKSYAPTLVTGILLAFIFISSAAQWLQMPSPTPG